ncbi:hypothetical protein D3C71_2118990 [compost metagenome]
MVTLSLPRAARISETDLHEAVISVLAQDDSSVTLSFRPFQIRTLKIDQEG